MEFKSRVGQNQRTPSPMLRPLSTISGHSLQGYKFAPADFPGNVSVPRVFPMPMSVNAREAFRQELEKAQIQRELETEEIRRVTDRMALARRQELEEEVRKEMEAERVLGIPMQRPEGILFQHSRSLNPRVTNKRMRMNNLFNNIHIVSGPQPKSAPQVDIKQLTQSPTTYAKRDKVIILAKPNVDHYSAKRKIMAPLVVEDNENSLDLRKKPKQEWRCTLCQINTTSERGLNDHFLGKKHKAKEASQSTQKTGLDTRQEDS